MAMCNGIALLSSKGAKREFFNRHVAVEKLFFEKSTKITSRQDAL